MLNDFMAGLADISAATAERIPDGFVVLMGIGTVFVGLICIIIICLVTGAVCGEIKKAEKPATAPSKAEDPRKRQELIAAVCAACAEDMGEDVSRLRVVSFKKIN